MQNIKKNGNCLYKYQDKKKTITPKTSQTVAPRDFFPLPL